MSAAIPQQQCTANNGLMPLTQRHPLAACAALAALLSAPLACHAASDITRRADVQQFAAAVAAEHNLSPAWVLAQLKPAKLLPVVKQLVMPPPVGTAKNWAAYRARFVEPRRIAAGLAFWRANEPWLNQAQTRWGVPAHIVIGVIGVETFFGQVTGNFAVLDALATLAFDFPTGRSDRSAFFRNELAELLVIASHEKVNANTLKGSYAGAMGLPQFMPSSVNRWALDFDGDGHIDLRKSAADTIGSVAHYLAAFGWEADLPTHFDVTPPDDAAQRATLLAPDIVPSFTAAQMAALGAGLSVPAQAHPGLLALVELHNGGAPPSYVAGSKNFYVVTRYNWSSYYAMAVIELGAAIAQARQDAAR